MMERIHKVNTIQRCDGARDTYLCAETDNTHGNTQLFYIKDKLYLCVEALQMELG